MKQNILFRTAALCKVFEGFESIPYFDSVGIESIGFGRNLEVFPYGTFDDENPDRDFTTHPMSWEEAYYFMVDRLSDSYSELGILHPKFLTYRVEAQVILLDMAYNMGTHGLLRFKNTLAAIESKDWRRASRELLDSKWARQTKRRAQYHAITMESLYHG
jgi:lysozyme